MAENKLLDETLNEVSGGTQYDHFVTYTVKSGDTFAGIAAFFGVSKEYLANLNNIPYPYYIKVGQPILVPKW